MFVGSFCTRVYDDRFVSSLELVDSAGLYSEVLEGAAQEWHLVTVRRYHTYVWGLDITLLQKLVDIN